MANITIYPNATSVLSWSATSVDTTDTENEDTIVTNSSGGTVYWVQGTNSGSVVNNGNMTCTQGATKKKWTYSETSGGAARITLTIVAAGGSPGGKSQGHGHG